MTKETKESVTKYLKENKRYDGRKLDEYREVKIEYDISKSAEGSARVKIGDTEVLAGVKMAVETPYPDTQEDGNLMVGVELSPMSNPEFESGPPSIDAIELARVVDRGIRESKSIDTKKLCIKKGEKVWAVMIDVCPINDSGNLFDASALAAVAALKNTKLPEYKNEEINYKKKSTQGLPIKMVPISVTVYKIGNSFIVDPLISEEKAMDARLTVALKEDNTLCALQKGGDTPLTVEDVDKMIDLATKTASNLRKKLKEGEKK